MSENVVQSRLFAVVPDRPQRDAVALSVTWRWSGEDTKYWLDVKMWDESTQEVFHHSSNGYRWKDVDAVGDAGLVVRWIRQARTHLSKPKP